MSVAIDFKDVDIIFGSDTRDALAMVDKGASRAEILEKTGNVLGCAGANLTVNEGEISVPRPPAPISAANTTMDSDSMIACVSPAMMVGSAEGSSTFHRSCRLVAPNASPASTIDFGTEVTPRYVSRTGVGMTKMMVTIRPGALPRPNSVSTGIR